MENGAGDSVTTPVAKRPKPPYAEVYCDLNARMTEHGFSLERRGSVDDLARLGLDLQSAVGRRFLFSMDDADDEGRRDDIMFVGTVQHDAEWGYLAVMDTPGDFFWRSHISVDE